MDQTAQDVAHWVATAGAAGISGGFLLMTRAWRRKKHPEDVIYGSVISVRPAIQLGCHVTVEYRDANGQKVRNTFECDTQPSLGESVPLMISQPGNQMFIAVSTGTGLALGTTLMVLGAIALFFAFALARG